jgi:hypothetical protein
MIREISFHPVYNKLKKSRYLNEIFKNNLVTLKLRFHTAPYHSGSYFCDCSPILPMPGIMSDNDIQHFETQNNDTQHNNKNKSSCLFIYAECHK